MTIEIHQLPALKDNYMHVLHAAGQTAVVDPTLATPVLDFLAEKNWQLDYILNTHHHGDHTGGNIELQQATGAKIIGYKGDSARIPGIDIEVEDNEIIEICGEKARVIFIPGHTLGHIAYYFEASKMVFSGDTLFSLGCGRLFEGTPEQMFTSLAKLAKLPPDTKIYCGHEYTEKNGEFALTIFPDNIALKNKMAEVNQLRTKNLSTLPAILSDELKTNPFLLANNVTEFAKVRKLKDGF